MTIEPIKYLATVCQIIGVACLSLMGNFLLMISVGEDVSKVNILVCIILHSRFYFSIFRLVYN